MRKLVVSLPTNRDFEGVLRLEDDKGRVVAGPFAVCGRADDSAARRHGNSSRHPQLPFGDTPLGRYRMTAILPTGRGTSLSADRFGPNGVIVLAPTAGDAALADANGRFYIIIQGGKLSPGRRLRPTNGSLRLTDKDQKRLVRALRRSLHCVCECVSSSEPPGERVVGKAAPQEESDPPLATSGINVAQLVSASPRFQHDREEQRHFSPPGFRLFVDSGGSGGGAGGDGGYAGDGDDGKQYQSGDDYSKVDTDFITRNEGGNIRKGYVPSSNSGVTVGVGFDLSQKSVADLKGMGLSPDLVSKLTPYLGLKGAGAKSALAKSPLNVTPEEADQINTAAFNSYFNAAGQAFNNSSSVGNFSELPWQAQTVLADLSYNMGSLSKAAPTFWKQMTTGDWQGAYNNLSNFSKKDKTLAARARRNAVLLKQAMDAGTLPKKK
jgi:GH24 family phage-related lysozyme (muramidase)